MNKSLSTQSIVHLVMEVLKILERVHASGFIFCDLKLDNILLGEGQTLPNQRFDPERNVFENASLHLIDFGFAPRFQDRETGEHLPQVSTELFQGNLIFSSLNQLKFKSLSRRDDLISLGYMMSFMLLGGKLPGINLDAKMN